MEKRTILLVCMLVLGAVIFGCKNRNKSVSVEVHRTIDRDKPPTMTAYWLGYAYFREFYTENYSDSRHLATEIVAVNGVWYRFERYYVPAATESLGTNVCKSTDKGMSWSTPVIIAAPGGDNEWSRYATDCGAYYDGSRWHMLFQSMTWVEGAPWNISYLVCDEEDATAGRWYEPAGVTNPVIRNKDIWDRIAVGTNHCTQITGGEKRIYDEGTPKILVDNGTIYVTFHGASVTNGTVYGYRGVAVTTDFITYTPAANDCIFDLYDARSWDIEWKGGSVGGGAAAYIKDGEYWYTMIESPDISLNCVQGQNWPYGLLRSKSLTNTQWEIWQLNPPPEFRPVGPSMAVFPAWSYLTLFEDDGITYLGVTNDWSTADSLGCAYRQYRLEWK